MTETEWADENPAPSKKLVPTWLWFCGGGCLLAVVLAVVAVVIGVGMFEDARDPDIQYASLQERIEMDYRPEEWELFAGGSLGVEGWVFIDSRGYMVTILRFGDGDAEDARAQMMDPTFEGSAFGMGGRRNAELTQIVVQGREIDLLTYLSPVPGQPVEMSPQGALLEITRPGDGGLLIMTLARTPGSSSIDDDEDGEARSGRITAEDVIEILAPFHVGPDR